MPSIWCWDRIMIWPIEKPRRNMHWIFIHPWICIFLRKADWWCFYHLSANDLAVDVKVEHAAFVSCANTLLTATGENGGILKETRTVKNVRNPVMARPEGTSGNSKGEHFFDLLRYWPSRDFWWKMEIVRRQDAEGKTSEFAKACSERLQELSDPVRTTCKHGFKNVCKSAQHKTLEALNFKVCTRSSVG